MRYDVKKFLFIGLEDDRKAFFKKAQEAGIINFIEEKSKLRDVPNEISQLTQAIKILRGLPTMEQEELTEFALVGGLTHKILSYKGTLDKLHEEERVTKLEISRVEVFGDFNKQEIAAIEHEGHRKVQFFFAKHGTAAEKPLPDEVIYVGTSHELDYFVAINKEPTTYPKLVEMHIERPIGELQKRLRNIQKEIHETDHRLKTYAKYNTFLHHALVYYLNTFNLQVAETSAKPALGDSLFAINGWVPVNKVHELDNLVKEHNVHLDEVAIEPTDTVPTYLENKGIPRIGEDVIQIYDTPSITDRDPSLWVLISFALFFAFIVGDGGYGLIFLATALYLKYKFSDAKGAGKRFINLFTILAVACLAWGVLTNSFFGINFNVDSPIRKVSLLNWLVERKTAYHMERKDDVYEYWVKKDPKLANVTDPREFMKQASSEKEGAVSYDLINKFSDNIMLELALVIGMTHIILSMLRYINRNQTNIGWILVIFGCYLYFPHYLKATSIFDFLLDIDREKAAEQGLYLVYAGVAIAMVIGIIKHKLLGILEVMTAIQVFADILSYLRLYALALAGAMVTSTLNDSIRSMPFVVAVLLVIVAHVVNITLAIMGGTIHGLRLNFLEWYHYSFEGGGKMFKPLRKVPIK